MSKVDFKYNRQLLLKTNDPNLNAAILSFKHHKYLLVRNRYIYTHVKAVNLFILQFSDTMP